MKYKEYLGEISEQENKEIRCIYLKRQALKDLMATLTDPSISYEDGLKERVEEELTQLQEEVGEYQQALYKKYGWHITYIDFETRQAFGDEIE